MIILGLGVFISVESFSCSCKCAHNNSPFFCLCQSLLYFSALKHQLYVQPNHCRSTGAKPQSRGPAKQGCCFVFGRRRLKRRMEGLLHSLQRWWIALPGGRTRPSVGTGPTVNDSAGLEWFRCGVAVSLGWGAGSLGFLLTGILMTRLFFSSLWFLVLAPPCHPQLIF